MAPRSGQTSIFGVVFFVFKSLLGIERQKKRKKNYNFDRKPQSLNMFEYRTWPIQSLRSLSRSKIFRVRRVIVSYSQPIRFVGLTLSMRRVTGSP